MLESIRDVITGDAPVFLLVAGPNGSGKSTFRAKRLDKLGFPCIDPDQVGFEMFGRHPASPREAIQATQEASLRVAHAFVERTSVGLETVFSDSEGHKLGLLSQAQSAGYRTVLIFIGVDSPEISIARVQTRKEDGGHDVPDSAILSRFPRCFENLKAAIPIVDLVILVDNSNELRHDVFGEIHAEEFRLRPGHECPHWYHAYGISTVVK